MNWALCPQLLWRQPTAWHWTLVLTVPIVMAAGTFDKSTMSSSLPEEESYRSSLSDTVVESSSWRSENLDYERWRDPPPPRPNRWRSAPSHSYDTRSTERKTEVFPEYEPGNPAFFNYSTREEEGQVKIFEFGR